MSWTFAFRSRQYLKESLWVIPLLGVVFGTLAAYPVELVDQNVNLPSFWTYSVSTAPTLLSAIVGATAALAGFVVTVSVLAVQMATSTFSARYMRLWYRDRMLKALLALVLGTLTFSFQILRRIGTNFVPNLGVSIAGALLVLTLLIFVIFFDGFLHRLRPVAVAELVARAGRRAFEAGVQAASAPGGPNLLLGPYEAAGQPSMVVRSSKAGAIQAIDERGLVRWAHRYECVLVLPHLPGDSLPKDAPLIEVYGTAPDPVAADRELRGMVAMGIERTIEQDPAFALRIMVDIAVKALSTSVNDPTTAVQVVNHLGDTLRLIGSTSGARMAPSPGQRGRPGVLLRRRRWEDYVALGVTEIREYGANSVQVMRRLRAMLRDLLDGVLPEHRPAVEAELVRLDQTIARSFGDSIDLDRAGSADRQGIGGRSER